MELKYHFSACVLGDGSTLLIAPLMELKYLLSCLRSPKQAFLLIAPLMELKLFIPFSVAFITNSFNRTAYGIEIL